MSAKQQSVSGTVIRGADGNLYFIPDSALTPFKVFDSEQERIEDLMHEAEELEEVEEDLDVPEVEEGEAGGDAPQGQLQAVYATLQVHPPTTTAAVGMKPIFICPYLEEHQ